MTLMRWRYVLFNKRMDAGHADTHRYAMRQPSVLSVFKNY